MDSKTQPLHLVVLGASGRTGSQVVKQALEKGWSVTAVVRKPEALEATKDEMLNVRVADVLDTASLAPCMKGADVVVNCLGPDTRKGYMRWSPVSIYSESVSTAVNAMREMGVKRYIGMAGNCLKSTPEVPRLVKYVFKPLVRTLVDDMVKMEDFLNSPDNKDINFTVVKPMLLEDSPKTDIHLFGKEGQFYDGCVIGRADVARFMLGCLTTNTWDRKLVAIKSEKDLTRKEKAAWRASIRDERVQV